MCCSSHLYGKQFPCILNKTTYFHMHIYISKFVIPLCCRYQVVLCCTCKECSKDMQFLATYPYYIPTTYTSRDILFWTASHLTIIKKILTNQVLDYRNYFLACLWPLSRIEDPCLNSLAYRESITDTTNDIEQTENKCVKGANYHFNKFSASVSFCSLMISAGNTAWWPNSYCGTNLQEKWLPNNLNKTTSICTFSFLNF